MAEDLLGINKPNGVKLMAFQDLVAKGNDFSDKQHLTIWRTKSGFTIKITKRKGKAYLIMM